MFSLFLFFIYYILNKLNNRNKKNKKKKSHDESIFLFSVILFCFVVLGSLRELGRNIRLTTRDRDNKHLKL
jgi:hypothetical protein